VCVYIYIYTHMTSVVFFPASFFLCSLLSFSHIFRNNEGDVRATDSPVDGGPCLLARQGNIFS